MNPMAWLNPARWVLMLAAVGALIGGYFAWEHHIRTDERVKVVTEYNVQITAQKTEAARVLALAMADAERARADLAALTTILEKNRDEAQAKNAADLRARRAGPRMQFTAQIAGCRSSGVAAQDGAPGATEDPSATVVQLPDKINGDLLELAADSQSVLIDYRTLYAFVNNPRVACELRE